MTLAHPRDSTIAVVGDGFGSALVYSTAVYLGFRPEQLTVYGPNGSPVATYQQFAYNLGQTILRSESESHFLPADWPTFAQLDAWARRSPAPLLRSVRRRYNPGVAEILAEATTVQRRLGWNDNRLPVRIGWLQREHQPTPHFTLYDEQANYAGRARHVMLALGHGPLSFPPALAKVRDDPELADRVVQAYEPKAYAAGGRYVVIGAGIASVNEWANALDAGARAVTVDLRDGGAALIRVTDDGVGMTADELPLALERHATSKLERDEDLDAIATLGFRGEALAAICAVSHFTLTSRSRAASEGRAPRLSQTRAFASSILITDGSVLGL